MRRPTGTAGHPLSRWMWDDTIHDRLVERIEQHRQHLVGCSSCSTCDSTALAWALGALLDAMREAGPEAAWTAQDVLAVLAESLL